MQRIEVCLEMKYTIQKRKSEVGTMDEVIKVNQIEYQIIKLLGHGKGGYSYLVRRDGKSYVLKQIHHEPCAYYSFGNKIEAEKNDYARLLQAGIPIPVMVELDEEKECLVKEFINGPTIYELICEDKMEERYMRQVKEMSEQAKAAGLNIDYFPTNFVVQDGVMYYVDYECNAFMEEWSFDNWGIQYWSKTPEFIEYVRTHSERV